MTDPKEKGISRRSFMAKTASATAGSVFAFQLVAPHCVRASEEHPAPSDQLRFGNIGVGGRGSAFLRPGSTVAICDVDQERLKTAAERVGGNPTLYTDYRKLLERKDIDGVFIGTPDHWHALMTVEACMAGKDVYVEKPASVTIEEGRAMVNAKQRYGRIVQVGSQGRSQEGAYHAKKYVANGQIGTVSRIECWHYQNPAGDWTPNRKPPEQLDYDAWLGPNRYIPYNPTRTHGAFRWMLDFGGGQIRDRGAHVMSVALWIMEADHTGPCSVEAKGTPQFRGQYDIPAELEITYQFQEPNFTLTWAEPGKPQEYPEFTFPRQSYGAKYYGDQGDLVVTYGDTPETDTEKKAKEYQVPEGGVQVFKSPGHRENFEACMISREEPIMPIEAAHRVATLCILGNLSYILGRKLEWDPVHEQVLNDEEANRMLSKPGREIWHL
jgi:predicted dehydrogenase